MKPKQRFPRRVKKELSKEEFSCLCNEYKIQPHHESIGLMLLNHMPGGGYQGPFLPDAMVFFLIRRFEYERNIKPFLNHRIRHAYNVLRKYCDPSEVQRQSSPLMLTAREQFMLQKDCTFITREVIDCINTFLQKLPDVSGRTPNATKAAACYYVSCTRKVKGTTQRVFGNVFNVSETTLRNTLKQLNEKRSRRNE